MLYSKVSCLIKIERITLFTFAAINSLTNFVTRFLLVHIIHMWEETICLGTGNIISTVRKISGKYSLRRQQPICSRLVSQYNFKTMNHKALLAVW